MTSPCPPPVFRRLVLICAAAALLVGVFFLGDVAPSRAQTEALVDYDLDNDGLIEVRTRNQLQAIHYDLNGDGTPENRGSYRGISANWVTSFPNAMPGAGCPPRDHDNDPATDAVASCIGYELIADIDASGVWNPIGKTGANANWEGFNTRLVGNGFRVYNGPNIRRNFGHTQSRGAFIAIIEPQASVEGLGIHGARVDLEDGRNAAMTVLLRGKIIGSYLQDGIVGRNSNAAFAVSVQTGATYAGLIAHSYVNGWDTDLSGSVGGNTVGGLVSNFQAQNGDNQARCVNSYFSGDIDALSTYINGKDKGLIAHSVGSGTQLENCYGDNSRDNNTQRAWQSASGTENALYTRSAAQLKAPTGYSGPFEHWDDYDANGTRLGEVGPRTDFWEFGDETQYPTLKAWGHDRTLPPDRSLSGAATVNLCTRNLAVANEIIRHLKDNVRRTGVATTPAAVLALSPCQSSTDTQEVSITNLTDLVVTSAAHPFNLRPDRTFPESPKLTTLDHNDFAYLPNAAHFDLSGNALESLPPRLFHGVPLRWLDLSQNELTSLPPDLFAGVAAVTETTGNSLQLAGNNLTDTGLSGRVFDPLSHLNGLDLSDNALTRINIRWFERLNNLGRVGSEFTPGLGLHLAGNTVTEHHYTAKILTGIRDDIVQYTGSTADATLRQAILTAMQAANSSIANVDIGATTTSFYANTLAGSAAATADRGYQPGTVTSCAGTTGPDRYDYVGGVTPDCYLQAHWSPPHKSADTAASAPGISTSGSRGTVRADWTHTASASFVSYQLRSRPTASDAWTPWLIAPITLASGAKSVTAAAPESGVGYTVQLRVITTTGPPSAPIDGTATTTPANWLSGFTAVTSTSAAGFITLNWTAVRLSDLPSGHSVAEYFYRYKLSSATVYGAWRSAGAGTRHTIAGTELTAGATYNVQLVGGIDDTDADATADYFTNRAAATAAAYTVPSSLSASSGTDPGTISLTWMRQMAFTHAQTRFQVRRKPRGAAWAGAEWIDVPDSTGDGGDSDTDTHNETGYMLTGLRGGVEYDIQVRLVSNDTDGPLSPAGTTGTATAVPAPTTFTATSGAAGALTLAWAVQTATSDGQAGYEMRYRYTGGAWTQWADIAGSTHSDTGHTLTGLLNNRSVEVALRFRWNNAVRTSAAVAATGTTGAVAAPAITATAAAGAVTLSWLQQTATTNTDAKYQLRYKKAAESYPTTGSLGWADIPNSSHSTNSHTVTDLDAGSYNFEVRFFWSEAIGAGAAGTATQSKTGIAAPAGLNATASSTVPGLITLAWTLQSTVTGSGTHYEFRHRVSGTSWPESGGWSDVLGSGPGTIGFTFSSRNNSTIEVELRLFSAGPGAAASASVTTLAVATPGTLTATAGAASIALSWPAQTATTNSSARYQVRYKKASESWPTTGSLGWAEISGSTHASTSHTLTGLDTVSYNVEVRFLYSPAIGTSAATTATATPTAFPTLTSVTAETGDLPYGIDVSWDAQSVVTAGGFQVRRTNWPKTGWGAWTDVPDSNDADMHTYDETEFTINAERTNWSTDVEVRYVIGTNVGPATRVSNVISGFLPKGYTARPGSTPGSIVVSWDVQTCGATAGHFIRSHRAVGDPWPTGNARWSGAIPAIAPHMGTWNATGYTLTGLTPGREYEMRITGNVCDGWYFEHAQPTAKARAAPVPAPQNLMASTTSGGDAAIALSWDVQTDAQGAQARYQVRHKKTADSWPATGEFGWADIPSSTHATTSHTVRALDPVSYDFEVRFVWDNTFGWSAGTSVTATPAAGIAAPANLAATPSAVPGSVDLTWDQQTARTTATTKFQVRYKATDETAWGTWADIPDSTDSGTDTHDETGYTVTGLGSPRRFYDFEVRLEVGDNPGSFARLNRIRAGYQPRGLTARTGTAPGTIDVSWDLQTANQAAAAQFATRNKFAPQNWPAGGSGWINIGDQADADSDSHNEVGYQYTGLQPGVLYDIVVSFTPDGTNYTHIPSLEVVRARAGIVPAPTNFRATTSSTVAGAIDLTWDQQSASTNAASKHQYRTKLTSESWPTTGDEGWTDIGDGADTNSHTYDESSATVPAANGAENDVQLRFFWTTALGASAEVRAMATASTVPAPTGLRATADYNAVQLNWDAQSGTTNSEAKYQVRFKKSADSYPAASPFGWADIPSSTHATNTYTVTGLEGGSAYDFELRFHWSDASGASASSGSVSATPLAVPTAADTTATTSVTLQQIDVAWTAQTSVTAATAKYQVRWRLTGAAAWGTWTDVPDSSADADSHAYNESSYTIGSLTSYRQYDVEVRFVVGTATGTATRVSEVRAGYHPQGMTAVPGAAPGTIDVSWTQQTIYTETWRRFHISYKLSSANAWGAWIDIADETADSHQLTALTAGAQYDVRMMFNTTGEHNWPDTNYIPTLTGVRAGIVQAPVNFTAATSTDAVNAVTLSWDEQTASTLAASKFQYRYKLTSTAAWSTETWNPVDDGGTSVGDSDANHYNETGITVTGLTANTSYDFQLRFLWNSTFGNSMSVGRTATSSAIPAPPNFTASSGTTAGTVDLSWDLVTDATKYQYQYKPTGDAQYPTSGSGVWTDVPDSASDGLANESSLTVTGLSVGASFDFQVRAHTASSNGPAAAEQTATAQTQAPPTGLTATAGTNPGEITISWTAPSATPATHTGFEFRYKRTAQGAYPSSWTDVPDSGSNGRSDETSYTISSLWAGVSYDVQIRAESNDGPSTPGMGTTATATAQVVAAPTGFGAARGSDPGELDLSWTVLATTGLPSTPGTPAVRDAVVRYEYRTKTTASSNWSNWAQVPDQDDPADGQADETAYTITGLTAYTAYDVQLRAAIHDNDEGTATTPEYYSASASDTNTRSGLAIPNDPQATGGTDPGEISINWVAQTTFGSTFTDAKYQIRYKLATASFPAASPYGWADISGSTRTSLATTLSGLMNRQLYDIELRFLPSSSLTSAAAKFQGTPTAVPVPTGLSAAEAMSTAAAIDVDWTAQTDTSGSEAKYQIRRKRTNAAWPTTSTEGWTDIPDSASDGAHNENETTLGTLDAGESYNVELRFHWSNAVGASVAASTTANAARIPAPPSFSATSGSVTDTVDLSWGAVSGITKFQYRHRLMGASWPAAAPFGWADVPDGTDTGSSLADETSYTVTGLTGGMTYDFELRAHTAAATFGPTSSDSANAQPQSPPTSYTATTGTNPGEIVLGWTAPAGSTHTGFQYRHKRTGQADSAYIDWADVPDSGSDGRSNETSYTITSLWAGVGYTVQIRAQASGNSASEPGASTTATATAKEVAAPTTLNATIGDGPGEIDITWTALATSGLPTGDAVVQYQYRTKLQSASWPTSAPLGWNNIPAANTSSYTITGLTAYTLYDIQLRGAIDDGSDTTGEPPKLANYHSDAVSATGARSGLARPANLRAAGGTAPGSLSLTWDAQTAITTGFSAAKYQVRSRLATATSWPSGGGWTDIASSGLTTASHTLTDLMNGRQYDVEVRFVPSISLMSAARSVRGTTTVVAVPAGFTASTAATTAGAIDLTWTAQSATSGSEAKYQYRRKAVSASWPTSGDMGWTDIADSGTDGAHNESSLTFTGLTAGASYHVELRFHWSNAVGASAATATLTARASDVPIPGSFTASSGSDAGEIDLSWSAVTNATYEYRYKLAATANYPTSGEGFWASAGSGTSYTITGLTARSTYNIQLRAVVSGSSSLPTPTATAQAQTTPGPANLTFAYGPNPGDIKIDWTRPALPAPVTHYEFRYKLATAATYPSSGAGHWAEVPDSGDTGTLQSDETTYTISGLQAGKSYHVQVRVFANQAIQYSLPQLRTQTARPVPPPTSFTASGGTNPGEVNLGWTAPTGVTILRYELRHRLGTTGAWSSWTSAGTATTYTYTTLLAGMPRTFEVRAVMQTVGASAPVSTTGTPTPVPTPASFTATTGVFPGEVDISWMAVTGATSYEYRYRLSSLSADPWPAAEGWTSVAATMTPSTTITLLNEGAAYQLEVRAAITNVGRSMAASASASARSASFTDSDARANPPAPAIPAAYDVAAAAIPGRIAIDLPGGTDPFIYRHRTVNPGQWSRWFKVTPQASQNQFLIPGLTPGVEYEIQVRAYTGMATGFTLPLTKKAQAAPLVAAEDFTAGESSGVILLQWSSPALYTPDYYEYRTKPTGTQTWSDWVRVDHEGDRGSTQRKWVTGLESGISHDFELRMQTGAGPSPVASSAGSARLRIAEVHSIRPTVREVSVRVGDTIALTVDIYDGQEVLDNSIPGKPGSKLVFRWEDKLADGSTGSAGGTFAAPTDERRVTYTAPSSPGRYIVTAEAQPDGVCTSHHEGAAEITDAEREQCTATFTIRVSGIPAVQAPRPDPVDPTGAIPTSMTDDKGGTYTVFTPTKGGTFTGDDITVTAPAGAIPDRTVVGIGATTSDIPTPDPVPGATMSLAGSYYDINAVADTGEPPIPSYTLNEPATACLPFPQEFRADLSNVVLVQRKSAGDLSILSTKIRSNAGDLTVCGTLTQLPATIAVARLGLVPAPAPTTPSTPADTPDTGATAPSTVALLLMLLTGLVVLTGMYRIRRIIL